jgi:hypothetical protein
VLSIEVPVLGGLPVSFEATPWCLARSMNWPFRECCSRFSEFSRMPNTRYASGGRKRRGRV